MTLAQLKEACEYILAHPWPPRCFPNEDFHLATEFHREKCEVWAEMKARLQPEKILLALKDLA